MAENRFSELEPSPPSTNLDKKKQNLKKKSTLGLTSKERKEANERMGELAVDFRKPDLDTSCLATEPELLVDFKEEVSEWQKKVASVMLTDCAPENECEAEKDIFKKLREGCARAGMRDKGSTETGFFNIISDKRFSEAVKQIGQGVVGLRILPVVDKLLELAMAGDKTCIKWALEISGIMPSKYDFYLARRQVINVNAGNQYQVSFEDKSDEELERIADDLDYDAEAEAFISKTDAE